MAQLHLTDSAFLEEISNESLPFLTRLLHYSRTFSQKPYWKSLSLDSQRLSREYSARIVQAINYKL